MGQNLTAEVKFSETEINGQRDFIGISWTTKSDDFSQDLYEQVIYAVCDTIGCKGDTYKLVINEGTGSYYVAYLRKGGKAIKLSCNFDAPTVRWALELTN